MERRRIVRRELDEHVTKMDAERLVKISRNNITAGRRSPGLPKRIWSWLKQAEPPITEKKKKKKKKEKKEKRMSTKW